MIYFIFIDNFSLWEEKKNLYIKDSMIYFNNRIYTLDDNGNKRVNYNRKNPFFLLNNEI